MDLCLLTAAMTRDVSFSCVVASPILYVNVSVDHPLPCLEYLEEGVVTSVCESQLAEIKYSLSNGVGLHSW